MNLLAGKTAVITGGSSGLGAAIGVRFAAEGATGAVLDLRPGTVPDGWDFVPLDIRDDASVAAAFGKIGKLDVLVAAAGIVPAWTAVDDIALADWDAVFDVNVRGMLTTFRHALSRMRDGGAIIAIGSLNSWRGDPNIAAYVASKHAVLGLIRSTALAVGSRGIRANALAPGPVATDALLARMSARERRLGIPVADALAAAAGQTALGRIATADDVASAALFLASPLAAAVTGHLLPVDGGVL